MGSSHATSGVRQDAEPPAFCATQGELHATNAGTWASNTVASVWTGCPGWAANEAVLRSEAVSAGPQRGTTPKRWGESTESFALALRCAVHAPRKPWVALLGHPSNAC